MTHGVIHPLSIYDFYGGPALASSNGASLTADSKPLKPWLDAQPSGPLYMEYGCFLKWEIPWNMFPYIYMYIYIYMVYSGKSHENWGPPKSSICSWVKPMVFSHPNPGCLVQTAILGQRRMLETHGGCLQLPYQHMGLSKD